MIKQWSFINSFSSICNNFFFFFFLCFSPYCGDLKWSEEGMIVLWSALDLSVATPSSPAPGLGWIWIKFWLDEGLDIQSVSWWLGQQLTRDFKYLGSPTFHLNLLISHASHVWALATIHFNQCHFHFYNIVMPFVWIGIWARSYKSVWN